MKPSRRPLVIILGAVVVGSFDAAKKVFIASELYSLIDPSLDLLVWLGDWAVWPSSQHRPLFTRFRQALGEGRPLIEAPGHLLSPSERDDAISIITVALVFSWNCTLLTASGRDAVFVSHDNWSWFASRDASRIQWARAEHPDVFNRRSAEHTAAADERRMH